MQKLTKSDVLLPMMDLIMGSINMEDFLIKFARISCGIHSRGTPEAIKYAGAIESRLCLYYIGEINVDGFCSAFRRLVNYTKTPTVSMAYVVSEDGTHTRIQN